MLTWARVCRLRSAVCTLLLLAASGCAGEPEGPDRLPISGAVTREGIPIDDGTIMFTPTGNGPASSTAIMEGRYEFTEENGVPAGKYKVTITQSPLRDPNFKGRRNEAPLLPDNRFKNKMPPLGWTMEAEVQPNQEAPIDFHIDE